MSSMLLNSRQIQVQPPPPPPLGPAAQTVSGSRQTSLTLQCL
jgi:hypothetical protein